MSGSPTTPRLRGQLREDTARDLARRYDGGESLRALVAEFGRSYGFVRTLVIEGGGRLRTRGGAHPKPRS
ncbi:helix-turn-helix domain-containing protein [Streptomyces sp. G1]|uniref:helix-turn-helix domain-containing protein n=1 Tax=Streptomyces sp. G1 TaxID=361572 RepID=UPI002030F233|nr:helix-turn-helix domain-containing protein [Streptomyces sp. G1]MCM1964902.1 helix-turn-helix domain-containing protein [Streptomyces sp. G1]